MRDPTKAVKIWLYFYPVIWCLGLYPVYHLALWPLAREAFLKPAKHYVMPWLYAFFVVQVISTLIALIGPFGDPVRFAAIINNILIYTIVIIGVNLSIKNRFLEGFSLKTISGIIIGLGAISIPIFYFSLYVANAQIGYQGVFDRVGFTRVDYLFDVMTPRLGILGDYVNTTAMLAVLLFFLYTLRRDERTSWLLTGACFLFALAIVLMSGSRICLLALVASAPITLPRNKAEAVYLSIAAVMAAIAIFMFSPEVREIITGIQTSRDNSSYARTHIYSESFRVMLETNPYTGLGLKPFYYTVLNYPLGSHSTFLGYITKCGILGLTFGLVYLFWLLYRLASSVISFLINKKSIRLLQGYTALAAFTMILFFEDIDAFALNALLFGCLWGEVLTVGKVARNAQAA